MIRRSCFLKTTALAGGVTLLAFPALADAIDDWLPEFQPTTISADAQRAELEWFRDAAQPLAGMEINVISEAIDTHKYESETLAKAFTEITGITVNHVTVGEGEVVEKLLTQIQSGQNVFDAYVNDSDAIGSHFRGDYVTNLTDWMAGEGADFTSPTLDLQDFMGLSFTTGPDGKVYQLPTQQFPSVYYFRKDWFDREDLQAQFKAKYGYDLGVPLNWTAYEDIADFFSNEVKEIDGERVYGHIDHGKKDVSLSWRIGDKWFALAGVGSPGHPNGLPVDEWGIRVDGCNPVGASVERGGALNGPAANYGLTKYVDWVNKYAPPEARSWGGFDVYPIQHKGIAQSIHLYTLALPGLISDPYLQNEDGSSKFRVAPQPVGAYWREGMPKGYQDVGSWTLLESTPIDRKQASWLYAQFVTSKAVSLRKTIVGGTPIRLSDIESAHMDEHAESWAGLLEFYRGPGKDLWTPVGTNVPDYLRMTSMWWENLGNATTGAVTPQEALDTLAEQMDSHMARLERSRIQGDCGPRLNDAASAEEWFAKEGSPLAKLADERPAGQTIAYEELLETWK